jgi:NitT/TauT family transport system ATP-binding protein
MRRTPPLAASPPDARALISARGLTKTFTAPDGRELPVLEGIDLDVREGEILALLGKSGSGKSTLLRLLAGLIAPAAGRVAYRDRPLAGTNPGVAMVFQSFALLPWLTVQQNVELGLEARGVRAAERAERAIRAIDLIGLDGFESAYPRELSGGMRQRVGFARALVVEPDVLLMDEPFSALDVLTAENLRGELLELWGAREFPTRAVVVVTHNIEEAVLLADRLLVLGTNPGRIQEEIEIDLPRPRDRRAPAFEAMLDRIYGLMTGRGAAGITAGDGESGLQTATPGNSPLPAASVDGIAGLLEILQAAGGEVDLADLADDLALDVDDLLPLVDAAQMLDFARVGSGRVFLTASGEELAGADIQDSKALFSRAALERAPLVRAIDGALRRSVDGGLGEGFFLDVLGSHYSAEEARVQLDVAIDWGRYAELYEYDAPHGELRRTELTLEA